MTHDRQQRRWKRGAPGLPNEVPSRAETITLLHSSKSAEWFTPKIYADAVRTALGGVIELDPATCATATVHLRPVRCFTAEDDGLAQPWHAQTVYCNPPYGCGPDNRSNQARWSEKFLDEHRRGHFDAGVLLVTAAIGEAWFVPLWQAWLCFPFRRI